MPLTADDIRNFCCEMAQSTGLYGRLVRDHDEAGDWEEFAAAACAAGCKDTLDFVMWWEG